MSRILRVEMTNWMAYRGEQAVDLPAGPIAVVATYADNERRSNWAGKTAFLEAIRWACWSIHRKRQEDRLIYTGEDFMSVALSFSDGVVIERARPRGGPTRIAVRESGIEGENVLMGEDAEEAIAAYLGLSYSDARATVLIEQGDTEALVGRTSSQRRETIAAWLELDLWDRLSKRARAGAAAAQQAVNMGRMLIDAPSTPERLIATIDDDIDRATGEQLTAIVAEGIAYEQLKRAHAAVSARTAKTRLDAGVAEGKVLREKIVRLPVVNEADDLQLDGHLENARERFVTARNAEDIARTNARGTFDGQCPVTKLACSVAGEVRANRTATEMVFKAAAEARSAADVEYRDCASADEVRRSERLERERLTTLFNAKTAEVRRLRAEADAVAADPDAPNVSAAELAHLEARSRTSRAEQELAALKAEKERAKVAAERRAHNAAALVVAERDSRRAALVLRALSPSGIQARVASAALVSLEERANALLSGSGLSFSLAWERELSDLAPTCIECGHVFKGRKDKSCPSCTVVRGMKKSDELDVLVRDDSGEEEDVREKSGGARALVASAIRLAGGAMLRERRASTVAWALVDESFGALDLENRESLARSFSSMLGSVGLEQALIVSHDAALLEAMPHKIRIVRDGSVSRLEVG